MEQKKYLVTGATGLVGSVLVKTLHEAGCDVTSLVLPGDNAAFVARYSQVRYADVCDPASLEQAAAGFDAVIHLAGIVDVGTGNRRLMERVNVQGTANVAELCCRRGMKMLHCSSVHAMPCLPGSLPMSEISEFNPDRINGVYGKTKAKATDIVLSMTKRGLDAMVAFPSGIIGPEERRISNIGQLIVELLCGKLIAYIDGKYNFVDVRDVVGGIIAMLNHWKTGGCYILSGNEISVREMLAEIAAASGRTMPKVKLPYWFVMATSFLAEAYYFVQGKKPLFSSYSLHTLRSNCAFSNQKARAELGYSTRPAAESLADMTRWILSHFVEETGRGFRPCLFREAPALA